ncbi:uncharacterized protein B0J16DRAFT_32530 [Fusarium flagelliforme]|uniref:uncharacterized protein n=1 Tax=Fusarium flagelliforme TaxID=2675880 RepID=UPI001E8E5185|nr:uncharacterized protein B0J16DRAFT_32530 [Fusarium flagelliforme]KAH7198010.1 hypothetical protein B0J16DRAFT_32530 [Fusarium flagelliforme]
MRQCNISSRNPIHSRIPIHLTLSPFFLFVCLFVPLELDWEQSTTQFTGQVSQNRIKSKSYITTKQKRSRAKASNLRIHLQDHPAHTPDSRASLTATTRYKQYNRITLHTLQLNTAQYNHWAWALQYTPHTTKPPPRCVPSPRLLLHLLCCLALPLFGLHRWFVLPLD